jgi:hypothetical protein
MGTRLSNYLSSMSTSTASADIHQDRKDNVHLRLRSMPRCCLTRSAALWHVGALPLATCRWRRYVCRFSLGRPCVLSGRRTAAAAAARRSDQQLSDTALTTNPVTPVPERHTHVPEGSTQHPVLRGCMSSPKKKEAAVKHMVEQTKQWGMNE